MMSHAAVTVCCCGLAMLAACGGPLSHTIDDGKLTDMSRQGQLWVYDAENEIVVALDQLDEARDQRREVRRRIRQAEKAIERAEKRGKVSAVRLAEGWLKHLESLDEWADANVQLRRMGVVVARASVEFAKAQIIRREDLLGGKNFSVDDYRSQHEEWEKAFYDRKKQVDKLRKRARKTEARWWRLRRQFVARTGDHDTGLWID